MSALAKARIATENYAFIRDMTDAVGIETFVAVDRSDKPYVRAVRRDGLPDLHIHWGFTNGFASEDDAVLAAGMGATRKPSSRKGTWYVEHPVTRVHAGSERSRSVRREADRCPCGMEMPLTGVCEYCG